jgi:8-oxo-dGTP pyrophosphatase MutT (NUDIX family)
LSVTFDIPRNAITLVERVEVRLDPLPHPFEGAYPEAIAANWQAEVAAQPALFNGRMALLSELRLDNGALAGRCHEVNYATFLYWKRNRAETAEHAFAHPALVSRDNALIAIRMGPRTANPGAVYFAAGSFEAEDFRDGLCDLEANMIREVREETGLDISATRRETGHQLFSLDRATAIFRRYWLEQDAEAIAQSIRDFVAGEADPEIQGPVIIRGPDDLPQGLRPHMRAFSEWHFGQKRG